MAAPTPLSLRVPAAPEVVRQTRHAVVRFVEEHCPDDEELRAAIQLAVSEAVANAVLHAYADSATGEVEVRATLEPDHLHVSVRDWGAGMRPHSRNKGLGMGFPFMQQSAQELRVRRPPDGGTEVQMSFPCRLDDA